MRPALRPIWLGVVWSRLGRADLAWAFWDRVGADETQAWLAAERGRVLREFGLHDEAERLEWPALAIATDPHDDAMLRISLTADAVGQGDVAAAGRRFEAAASAVAALPDGPRAARQRLRLAWVDVEVAFVAERPRRFPDLLPTVGADGELHLPDDLAHGTQFHRAKSLLFAGVVTDGDAGELLLDAARRCEVPVLDWAIALAQHDRGLQTWSDAVTGWNALVPPPGHEAAIAATPTARRLAAPTG